MLVLGEDQIRSFLHTPDLVAAMEKALADFSTGRIRQPVRTVVPLPEHGGLIAFMPAADDEFIGVKLVTVYEGNAAHGLPTHLASIQLFRAATGEPVALFDGRLITEMRTAAVSAVATRLLSKQDARVLALIGSGVQARAHARALRYVRAFEEVRVWSPVIDHARKCAAEIGAIAVASAEQAVRDADVVVVATHAVTPVVRGAWLSAGAYVNAIGAIGAGKRELDDEAMNAAVVVESRDSALIESADIVQSGAQIYAELGELLAGTKPLPPASSRVVFKSLGIAVEDLAAAKLVYKAADGAAK